MRTVQTNITCQRMEGGIACVTLNRPSSLNALNMALLSELQQCLLQLAADRDIRALIITGNGRAFAAGADLFEVTEHQPGTSENFGERYIDNLKLVDTVFRLVEEFPRPVVAAINGYALGGGCELALTCDFRIASNKAILGFPEASMSLCPSFGGTQRLPRLIGVPAAKELMFSARKIHAQEALQIGLVDRIAEPEDLLPACVSFLEPMLKQGPIGIKYIKMAINEGIEMPLQESLYYEKHLGALSHMTADGAEGVLSFKEKRSPSFQNK